MKFESLQLEITESGEVFFQGKKCHTLRATRGYNEVRLPLHRLVAQAFHGSPEESQTVCHHIDGNPRNNAAANLKWVTQQENMSQRCKPKRKLTDKQVSDIRAKYPGPRVTLTDLARKFGVSMGTIERARMGATWKGGWYKHNRRVLTSDQLKTIMEWRPPTITAAQLARQYNVSDATIFSVWHGRYPERSHR